MEQFPTLESQEVNSIEMLKAEIAQKKEEINEIIEQMGGISTLDQEALVQMGRISTLEDGAEKIAA